MTGVGLKNAGKAFVDAAPDTIVPVLTALAWSQANPADVKNSADEVAGNQLRASTATKWATERRALNLGIRAILNSENPGRASTAVGDRQAIHPTRPCPSP